MSLGYFMGVFIEVGFRVFCFVRHVMILEIFVGGKFGGYCAEVNWVR